MSNARKALIGLFIAIIIVSTLVHTVLAQKNETKDILQQENKTTTPQNATFSEVTQKSEVTKEDIIIEAQRSLDRSLSILNIVATLMGVLVGMFAFIVAIAAATGYFGFKREIDKMQEIKKNIEKDAEVIKKNVGTINELKSSAEKIVESMRSELAKVPQLSLTEKPSNEVIGKLDEFGHRLELLEILGVSLKPDDYLNRGNDLYYKGKYELAIKAYDKAIELKSDYALAWTNKGVALRELNRPEEALKAHEKAIELKPDDALAWFNRACAYSLKGDKEKALSDLRKAIDIDNSYKEKAKKDKDFEWLWDDKDFKKLVN